MAAKMTAETQINSSTFSKH